MIAEVEVLLHVDDVVQVVLVFPLYDVQNLQLDQSLVMEPARLKWKGRLAIIFLIFFFNKQTQNTVCLLEGKDQQQYFQRLLLSCCVQQSVFHEGENKIW